MRIVAGVDIDAIESARKAFNNLTDDQKAKISDDTLKKLKDAEEALDAAEQDAVNKTDFNQYKTDQKNTADTLAQDKDSEACQQLIDQAKTDIDNLPYDDQKTLDENKSAVDRILDQLKTALEEQRTKDNQHSSSGGSYIDSDILKGNLASFTTVPEIVGGKASFITDGLHYSDNTLATIIQYIVNH